MKFLLQGDHKQFISSPASGAHLDEYLLMGFWVLKGLIMNKI